MSRDKQSFLDEAAIHVMGGLHARYGIGNAVTEAQYAVEAYNAAGALWEEREQRRLKMKTNGGE